MSEETKASFEGWAVVEVFGHNKYAGFVTTQHFGQAAMFRVEVPALDEREKVLRHGTYAADGVYLRPGAKVRACAVQGYVKLLGVSSIFAITPCTEAAALAVVEEIQPRPLVLIEAPVEQRAIAAALDEEQDGE